MNNQSDLQYTADGIRDRGGREDHVQSSMQEETAKAIHRLAEAQEETNKILRRHLSDD